jgi:pimeloyl-ACP methyl ester carboxylesterase
MFRLPTTDVGLDMIGLVQARGYKIESYAVTTADGYVLTMFRIPGESGSKPVILQHGLLDSSYTWINNYADQSLGYILSDAGFDVWFGNNRGNRYGRSHAVLDPDDKESGFWDFSWDEMAFFDAPAMINFVLDATNLTSVSWVGHSEGTIQVKRGFCL